jgi:hypothetical protein
MKKTLLALGASILVMTACASSGPTVVSNTQPGVKMKNFETWDFMQPLGTDRSGARTRLSSKLMNAMMVEMQDRGLRRSNDEPDLLVDFIVTTEERLDVRQTPNMNTMHRSHWSRGFSTWPSYSTTVRQYTQGTLLIDIIDIKNNALIAEGAAEGRIRSEEITQNQATELVTAIMKDLW